jgi:hypothetical protein
MGSWFLSGRFLSAALVAGLVGTVALAGCGGSSGGGGSASASGGGTHAITAGECQQIRSVIGDLESLVAGGGLDYVKDAATVDRLGATVSFPSSVSHSYETWQEAIDKLATGLKEAGVKPNDTPLPSQMDELNSKFQGSDSLNKAGGTISTWVSNGCD